jgi:dUTP pyrophosphatase
MALKFGIAVGAGVIDSDYRGEIKVLLINIGDDPYYVSPGDRIAQLLIQPIMRPTITEMDLLPRTDRGKAGFGSTGL